MRGVTAVLLRGRGTAARFMAAGRAGRRSRRRAKPGAPPPQGAVSAGGACRGAVAPALRAGTGRPVLPRAGGSRGSGQISEKIIP